MRVPILMQAMAGVLLAGTACITTAAAATAAGDWVMSHNSRIRLIAADVKHADGIEKLTFGVQIELDPGWKTYWRTPGDAGGVPPEFDWSKSSNLASARVLFPAPSRLTDPLGDSIGYKHGVLFPAMVKAEDPAKPVGLQVAVTYGVCAKICIPEEHTLVLGYDPAGPTDPAIVALLTRALGSVPSTDAIGKDTPKFTALKLETAGEKHSLLIEAQFPASTGEPQAFAEAFDNSYVPMPQAKPELGPDAAGGAPNSVTLRFRIDLGKSDDLKQPSGKKLRLTLVGDDAASEAVATIP